MTGRRNKSNINGYPFFERFSWQVAIFIAVPWYKVLDCRWCHFLVQWLKVVSKSVLTNLLIVVLWESVWFRRFNLSQLTDSKQDCDMRWYEWYGNNSNNLVCSCVGKSREGHRSHSRTKLTENNNCSPCFPLLGNVLGRHRFTKWQFRSHDGVRGSGQRIWHCRDRSHPGRFYRFLGHRKSYWPCFRSICFKLKDCSTLITLVYDLEAL